ncbi:hypothetical protein F8M41_016787 [Gigaspora margarita]|uniref:Uncharacterized protein n=1 Tax=Gigaspora margarita TaxID=4874 RepID=A0A8H4EUU0_GIGMA|nr:hypothetical protein F8M41_016787 [Gigaspora margarita]
MNLVDKTTKCCCCVPLRGGVISITILSLGWLAYTVVIDILSLVSGNNTVGLIVDLVISSLFLLIFIFGFIISCFTKDAKLLRIYAILYDVFVAIIIFDSITNIIAILASKSTSVNNCISGGGQSNVSPSNNNNSASECEKRYWLFAAILIVFNLLIIFLVIHFALVISAYAANRKAKEMKAALVHEITESNISSAHGTSTHGTSTHGTSTYGFAGKT